MAARITSLEVGPKGVIYLTDGDWFRKFENGAVTTLNAGTGRRDGPLDMAACKAARRESRARATGRCVVP